ncbi:OmpA/MotB family protein [Magnetococcales bacterium HHB-1]
MLFQRPGSLEKMDCEEENSYWISFSDIMSSLLVVFILASLALILELTQTRVDVSRAIQEIAQAEQIRHDILHEIFIRLKAQNIHVEISENNTVLRISDHQLSFSSNEYTIPEDEQVRRHLREVGRVIYGAIVRKKRWRYLDTIFVEGHTDQRPSPRHMGNWGLSTFRAISVWSFWNQHLPNQQLSSLTNHAGKPLFSVSGYAQTRPLQMIQEDEGDFRKNRRIDIRFTVRRPAIEEFEHLKKMLGE